jgi:hypothetical protein
VLAALDARIIDQQVDRLTIQCLGQSLGQSVNGSLIGHVERVQRDPAKICRNQRAQGVCLFRLAAAGMDMPVSLGEIMIDERQTDASVGSGNDAMFHERLSLNLAIMVSVQKNMVLANRL